MYLCSYILIIQIIVIYKRNSLFLYHIQYQRCNYPLKNIFTLMALYNTQCIDNILYFYDFVQNARRITYLDVVIFIPICCEIIIILYVRIDINRTVCTLLRKRRCLKFIVNRDRCRKLEGSHDFTSSHFRFTHLPIKYIIL